MNRAKRNLYSEAWKKEPPAQTVIQSMQESERITNVLLGRTMLAIGVSYLLVWFLTCIDVYNPDASYTVYLCWGMFFLSAVLFCLAEFTDGRPKYLRIVLAVGLLVVSGVETILDDNMVVPYLLLLVLSTGYSDRRFTVVLSAISAVEMVALSYVGAVIYWYEGLVNLNYFRFPGISYIRYKGWNALNLADYMTAQEYAVSFLRYHVSTALTAFAVCCLCCFMVANRNYHVLLRQHARDEQRVAEELEYSRNKAKLLTSNSRLLVSQIQPHFVYNVLNSIYHLCDIDSSMAQQAVSDFSDYLRSNLCALDADTTVSFQKEKQHIETYLRLEKMRFGDRLKICWDIQTCDFSLPELGLQPMVENAVKHGICKRREGGTVTIATRETSQAYIVNVIDDGVGFDTEKQIGSNHVGISNVRSRLEILCNASLTVESTPGHGTTVTVTIPKEAADENTGH